MPTDGKSIASYVVAGTLGVATGLLAVYKLFVEKETKGIGRNDEDHDEAFAAVTSPPHSADVKNADCGFSIRDRPNNDGSSKGARQQLKGSTAQSSNPISIPRRPSRGSFSRVPSSELCTLPELSGEESAAESQTASFHSSPANSVRSSSLQSQNSASFSHNSSYAQTAQPSITNSSPEVSYRRAAEQNNNKERGSTLASSTIAHKLSPTPQVQSGSVSMQVENDEDGLDLGSLDGVLTLATPAARDDSSEASWGDGDGSDQESTTILAAAESCRESSVQQSNPIFSVSESQKAEWQNSAGILLASAATFKDNHEAGDEMFLKSIEVQGTSGKAGKKLAANRHHRKRSRSKKHKQRNDDKDGSTVQADARQQ